MNSASGSEAWNLGYLILHNHHLEKVLNLTPIIDELQFICVVCSTGEILQGSCGHLRTSGLLWGRASTDGVCVKGLSECPFLGQDRKSCF